MKFCVSKVSQSASGGSFVIKYKGSIEFAQGNSELSLNLVSTIPETADPELLDACIDFVRRGAVTVLRTHGLRGTLELRDLFIHDVDCRPPMYELATVEALERLMADYAEQAAPPDRGDE